VQVTAVGMTAPVSPDGKVPSLTVQNFDACGATKSADAPKVSFTFEPSPEL
jgi:hypothetical protein